MIEWRRGLTIRQPITCSYSLRSNMLHASFFPCEPVKPLIIHLVYDHGVPPFTLSVCAHLTVVWNGDQPFAYPVQILLRSCNWCCRSEIGHQIGREILPPRRELTTEQHFGICVLPISCYLDCSDLLNSSLLTGKKVEDHLLPSWYIICYWFP